MLFEITGLDEKQKEMFIKELTVLTDKYAGELNLPTSTKVNTSLGVMTTEFYHDDSYPSVHISFVNEYSQQHVVSVEVVEELKLPRVLVYERGDVEEPTSVITVNLLESPKLFKCNAEVAEWCIARNKIEAYVFMSEFWDNWKIMDNNYSIPFLRANPGKTLSDFIETFFTEEDKTSSFTDPTGGENNKPVTKLVSDWIKGAETVPCYLCHEAW